MRIAAYITGHGYGHATRAVEVLRAARSLRPDCWIAMRTLAPDHFFRAALAPPLHVERAQVDVGAVEHGGLSTDPAATIAALEELHAREEEIVAREVAFLRQERVDVVLSDVPPLASEIAHRAGIPSVAVANFTWDRIYAEYPGSAALVERIRECYAKTTLGLEVPLGHPVTAFPRMESIPIIARHPTAPAAETRRALGLRQGELAVLVVLRGGELAGHRVAAPPGVRFVAFSPFPADRVLTPGPEWQARFPDLVAACDVVLSKPGYGIVAECLAARRPMIHLPREGFAETPHLLAWMDRLMPHTRLDQGELGAGSLPARIHALAAAPWPAEIPRLDGAEAAARCLTETANVSR